MPIIGYKELEKHLQDRGDNPFFPVYLICGEDLLTKGAFDALLNALIPASERSYTTFTHNCACEDKERDT